MRFSLIPSLFSSALILAASASASTRLDERGLAITATTTRTVQAYVTETVYIYPNNKGSTVTTTVHAQTSTQASTPTTTSKAITSTRATSSSSVTNPTSLVLVVQPTSTRAASSSIRTTSTRAASSSTRTTSTSAVAATETASGTDSSRPIVAAYYPDWVEGTLSPEQLDWSKFDWIDFAFAVLDSNLNIVFTGWDSDDLLKRTVRLGHAAGKKVKLSIGGWTGSAYFSTAVSTAAHRQDLANKMLAIYNQYNLDGLDIDWEYPVIVGDAGNRHASDDSAKYLLFLQLLRQTLPAGAKITAATQVWPFAGPDENPLTDVSGFAEVFDWITIMNYDVWGSSSTPGPNAPLSDGCGDSLQPLANAYAAVNSWHKAGMPYHKMLLGTAAYGYISSSSASSLVTKRSLVPRQLQHSHKRTWSSRRHGASAHKKRATVTVTNDGGGTTDGQVMFSDLIRQGALVWDNSARKWVGGGGFTRLWDSCSSTPFLRSTAANQVITYDDPDSLSLKAQFAKAKGLGGVNVWDAHGDNAAWDLMDALRGGLGL